MSQYMAREMELFFCALWNGAILLFVYDTLRIVQIVFLRKKWMQSICDIGFGLGSGIYLAVLFFEENNGVLRSFLFLGVAVGIMAWRFSGSRYYRKVLRLCLRKIKEIIGNFVKWLKFCFCRCKLSLCTFVHVKRGVKNEKKKSNKEKGYQAK